MKLREFHVFQRKPRPQHHGVAIAGASMRRRAGEIHAAIAAGCQHGTVGTEQVELSVLHIPGQHAAAYAVIIHQEIEREIFDKERGIVLLALLVNRVKDRMPRTVRGGTGALRHLLAVIDCLTAKGTLINLAFAGS